MLEKQSTGKPALERAAKVHQSMKERAQKQRRMVGASAGAGSDASGGFDAELDEANRGLPLGWKAKRSQNRCKGRIYWYHEGGTAAEQWHKPST